jgi:PKD repeat protein
MVVWSRRPVASSAQYTATLNGANEVPPVMTAATGLATFNLRAGRSGNSEGDDDQLNATTGSLSYTVSITGIANVRRLELRQGASGTVGTLVATLRRGDGEGDDDHGRGTTFSATGTLRASDLRGPLAGNWAGFTQALAAGGLYLNVVTGNHSTGEVRGQILPTTTLPNQAPIATITLPAADATIVAGQSVTFVGTATDPDGDAVTVLWDFGDGTSSASLTPPAHAFPLAGSYLVTLTATDARGLSNSTPATRTITVTPSTVNQAPNTTITAPTGNVTITAGQSVTFAGTATDPNGDLVTVVWSFGDGSSSTLLAPGAHAYPTAGTYTVTLTATDAQGLVDPTPSTLTVTVQAVTANLPPVGVITAPTGNVTITAGQSVTFTGTASDPNGDAVTVLWAFGDGTTSTALAPGAHTYATAGTFTVTFTATDALGLAATAPPTRTITVSAVTANSPPTGVITAPTGNVTIAAGQSVTFAGTASDPNGNPVTVLWAFGDGATSTALSPGAHVYAAAGTYTARLTATDSLGLADPAPPTRTITVTPVVVSAPTLTQLQTTIFTPSCVSCHDAAGAAGLNLTAGSSYSNLVNVPATTFSGNRVVPGSPSTSALVTQLAGGHRSVSAANQQLIVDWITAGALNN